MTITVNLEPTIKTLQRIGDKKSRTRALTAAAVVVENQVRTYPPVRKKKQPFKTDKQRRYFFYALKRGLIKVPYRRDGLLQKR